MSFRGVLVPVITPFKPDLTPDGDKFVALCKHLLAQGAGGLAVFGTTSEANSISGAERKALLERLIESGIPADKLMPGTGACSVTEASDLTAHATAAGCGGVLLLPPFYYKGVSDDGIYGYVDTIIQTVGSDALKVYLYHIPPVAQVGYSLELVGRLHGAYHDCVVGLKDSSGDWHNTAALLHFYPDMAIFPGSEVFLLEALKNGGAGCITATGNVNLPMVRALYETWSEPGAADRQAEISKVRQIFQDAGPVIAVIKAYYALATGDEDWATVRPPLTAAARATAEAVAAALGETAFTFTAPSV